MKKCRSLLLLFVVLSAWTEGSKQVQNIPCDKEFLDSIPVDGAKHKEIRYYLTKHEKPDSPIISNKKIILYQSKTTPKDKDSTVDSFAFFEDRSIQCDSIYKFDKYYIPSLTKLLKAINADSLKKLCNSRLQTKPIIVSNSIIRARPDFRDSCLECNNPVYFRQSYFKKLSIADIHFNDTCLFQIKNMPYFTQNNYLSGKEKAGSFRNMNFKGITVFLDSKDSWPELCRPRPYQTEESVMCDLLFRSVKFDGRACINQRSMKNVRFQNVTFKCPFSLAGKTLDSCAFIGCSFDSVLDVRRIEIDSATVFKDNYFNNGCCIIIRPSDEIERIGIDIMSFQKLFFIIDWGWRRLGNTCVYWDARSKRFAALIDNSSRSEVTQHPESLSSEWPFDSFTQRDLDRVVLTFDKLKDYAGKLSMNDDMFGSGKQKAVSWLDYQKNQYYKQFYSKHNTLQCLQYCFLAQTYKGEGKFLFICFILIALFAVVFHVGFSKEIDLYIKDKLGPKDPKEKPKEPLKLSFDRDLIKAFFASGVIFFTPKIPFKVFKYSRSLCWWVLAEWAIGTVFMVLFLIFIAGKYPIITKLLGL